MDLSTVKDAAIRYALDNIQRALFKALFLNGDFRLIDVTFSQSGGSTYTKIGHGLGVKPMDMISLYTTPGLIVNIDWNNIDATSIPVNPTQAGRWRAIVGNFKGV